MTTNTNITESSTSDTNITSGASRETTWSIPLIGHMATATQFKIIGTFLGICVLGSVVSGGFYIKSQGLNAAQNKVATELTGLSQKVGRTTGSAIRGDAESFKELEAARDVFDESLRLLKVGGKREGLELPAPSASVAAKVSELEAEWASDRASVSSLIASKEGVDSFAKGIVAINSIDAELANRTRFFSAQLMIDKASPGQQALAQELVYFVQRMGKSANTLAAATETDYASAFLLQKDSLNFKRVASILEKGNPDQDIAPLSGDAKVQLLAIKKTFDAYSKQVVEVQKNFGLQVGGSLAYDRLVKNAVKFNELTAQVVSAIEEDSTKNGVILTVGLFFFAMFLVSMAALVKVFSDESRSARLAAEIAKKNQVQEESIMRLLDEISAVAEGDLTVKATLNDNFTGAIADSINFTVAELRRVILDVIETADRVDLSSGEATGISEKVAVSAKDQYDRLAKAGESIVKMSGRMDEIASDSTSAVAAVRGSMDSAEQGMSVVSQSINRMNQIRDTIQDTSKRIKLLGESSTAIGEVTGLIRDITKQINILALNAAIQAAAAGEAGRGFAVVAQEVQRLAESSADAAQRIDELVLTIQDDAKGAVASMEQSTREVVEGAKLTDKAGDVLKQIGESVAGVAKVIESITEKIQVESDEATNVSLDMRLLQEFTEKTLEDTGKASDNVTEVRNISSELKKSVSNFKV